MAAKTTSQVNLELEKVTDSKLWKRLNTSQIKATVETTATHAETLLSRVQDYMPLYTFHNRRHILNIIGWMDWLLEPILKDISPLEAALCLLSAYTHDLAWPFRRRSTKIWSAAKTVTLNASATAISKKAT